MISARNISSLDDQVDQDSVVRLIDKVVDVISKEEVFAKAVDIKAGSPISKTGTTEVVHIWIYKQSKKLKKVERECKLNMRVMWLMGKLRPDHWTISKFRKDNTEEIKSTIKSFNGS